ncbi:DUF2177 family protein [Caballeronia telluris]|nr:DUF2177 family protein [Caballeronia telluris]
MSQRNVESKVLVVAFAVGAVVFLALDALWVGVVGRGLCQREIGALLVERPNFARRPCSTSCISPR